MKPIIIKNIQLRLLLPYVVSLFLIIVSGLWSLNIYQKTQQAELISQINSQLTNDFNRVIHNDIVKLEEALFFIANNSSIQSSWQNQNRQQLKNKSLNIYSYLKQSHNISHFYYHDVSGVNYLRVHAPKKHGDIVNRKTLTNAMSTGVISSGIEFGLFGEFVLRVVYPWKINNKLVGYIELGEEINHIVDKLSQSHQLDLLLTIDKSYIVDNQLDKSDYFKNKTAQFNEFKNLLIVKQTLNSIPQKLRGLIDADWNNTGNIYQQNNNYYFLSRITQFDYFENNKVSLYYLADISSQQLYQQSLRKKLVFIGAFVGGILFIFYFLYSKKLQSLIQKNYDLLENEIERNNTVTQKLTENKLQLELLINQKNTSLVESKKRYQMLFDKTADALLIIEGHQFVDCNQATLDMLGYQSKEELYNTHPSKLSPEYQPDGIKSELKADEMIEKAFAQGSNRFEWNHMKKNGEVFPVEVLLTAITFENTQLLHVVWRDITDRKLAEAEVKHQAYYDSLTGLPNRRMLVDRMKQVLSSSRRHHYFSAVLFMDLDRFKSINDSLGHGFGDKLLIKTAERIKASVWDLDTVSRFGGDEFVILLNQLSEQKETAGLIARKICQRIQQSFIKPFMIDDHELHITTSIGISIFPFHEESIEDIIKHADTAMYSAKENGRNQVAFYYAEMHEKVLNKLTLEKDLRAAILENQLQVYYQPQLNKLNKLIGVEALIRWQHPQKGFINPEEFIQIAEETGLIYEIGEFVLQKSLTDITKLNAEENISLKLSVNISPRQFKRDDFVFQIKNLIENFQLNKNFLTLEVTESIALENLSETIAKFEELKHAGAMISLDDFGTGYSSLSYLKRLPINELKIDKSFVFDICEDPQDALLVKTIINIAHQFGLHVVAEGVETKEQLAFLQTEECDIYQGYYHSKPLSLAKLKVYVHETC